MPRSRPASNPLSFHKATGQHYVTRGGRRVYLGADRNTALTQYHRLAMGLEPEARVSSGAADPGPGRPTEPVAECTLTVKELANRFIATQEANWRAPRTTKCTYVTWLARFLADHPRLLAANVTLELFAAWKLALRARGFAPKSINHYLGAVRAMFKFAEDAGLLARAPRLNRVRNESKSVVDGQARVLYTPAELSQLLTAADIQMQCMILLALNCGFGPKDMQDLCWDHFEEGRVVLPRSKTGVSQTFTLWPETTAALARVAEHRQALLIRLRRRGRERSDDGRLFMTKYWRTWNKDAVAEQFRKLCKRAKVPCYGFYRLRHCASTAMALVAMPHVHRRFMRHKQLQQQVTYTHTPDAEVDVAVMRAREKLFPSLKPDQESDPGLVAAVAPPAGAPREPGRRAARGTR